METKEYTALSLGDLIDELSNLPEDSVVKVREAGVKELLPVDPEIHAYKGDYYEVAFTSNFRKRASLFTVREFSESLSYYADESVEDYGSEYYHDSDLDVHFAGYAEVSNKYPVAVFVNEDNEVVIDVREVS